ncbi:MAG: hypothetical protein HGB32_06585 [Geobacteraceae bacterium]|nr:hypothetical protein [Geobacteraceae bacterium]NTW79800.1 hypothetical protein [Geobacteraceae bacterium]
MELQNTGNTAVIAAVAAAAIAFLANIITTIITFKVAKLNTNKDLRLQNERLHDDRNKAEISFLRAKLEEVHNIISKTELENSQTISFFHSTSGIPRDEFRSRYLENCERIHKAVCVTDLYFVEISPAIRNIYNQMNLFWGNQESLLGINASANQHAWDSAYAKLLDASNIISSKAQEVQREIVSASEKLSSKLN